jgi:hydrogenase/urease accessory protein HupE
MRAVFASLCVLVGAWAGVGSALAHDTRPLYVEIDERSAGVYSLSWKVPITVAATNIPTVSLPDSCRPTHPVIRTATARSQTYACETDLSNEAVSIDYPRYNPSISTLVHFIRLSGETHSEVLAPDKSEWIVPAKENTWQVARDYTVLGIEHILEGVDHLLFIVCLVLLAGTLRRVVITITGFTIAHSITLGLAALGLITVPVAAVEASIALSIVFVASELARGRRQTLTWRYPIAVSSTFGLLHGFGFASVLSEIGLPQTEVPAALLFFNVGVEIGQILFVLASVVVFYVARRLVTAVRELSYEQALARVQRPAGYLVGTLAMFWTIERVSTFWV